MDEIEKLIRFAATYQDNPPSAILKVLQAQLVLMRSSKPVDRSDIARAWAVSITEFEKMIAYFAAYVVDAQSNG